MSKRYRPNVAAIILSPSYPLESKIFIAKRNDLEDAWQFPQGGIDEGEDAKTALLRELEEEIGTCNVEIIDEYPEWISYDFPEAVAKKMPGFDGQNQKYFLLKLKSVSDINLNTKDPEFEDFKFVDSREVVNGAVSFKKVVYLEVIKYFRKKGYL
ncbi:MAG: Adenosine (5')-pentaphospho-(5'')-adenosine pyrophosphohydrolase (EC [uncultured Campylobacterales bacterium]|uniref:Adenosine (5')-pentaphospho-(5'')-adenosine pyrophosphohydrolase (EC) n=1 Tax=uncultured Campylobacterales bacterium TaxID=352960 RepID=A0A6S6T4Y7_9BACT|nr:MAG: Adenosine (5')-pentaphospho-(5'')-adenosine pyrophosphohydrolase (EC [uncultured Campylobacterales bacterium]